MVVILIIMSIRLYAMYLRQLVLLYFNVNQ